MSEHHRLPDYLEHIQQAAADACSFVEGLAKEDFLADKRTQQAVIMSLIIVGEAATKVMDGYAEFTQSHPEVPGRTIIRTPAKPMKMANQRCQPTGSRRIRAAAATTTSGVACRMAEAEDSGVSVMARA